MRFRYTRLRTVACVLAGAMLCAVPAMAAFDTYMTITGSKQGQIRSRVTEKLAVVSVLHDQKMATGMATGRRQHGSITIKREVDEASPKLMQAMRTNEVLGDVTIMFGDTRAPGKSVRSVTLMDATITSDRKVGDSELITFEYSKIEVTWTDGGKTATDDWEAPI